MPYNVYENLLLMTFKANKEEEEKIIEREILKVLVEGLWDGINPHIAEATYRRIYNIYAQKLIK